MYFFYLGNKSIDKSIHQCYTYIIDNLFDVKKIVTK